MATATRPLIDLDALTDRIQIRIGGRLIVLRTLDELPPLQGHRIGLLGRRLAELVSADTLSPEDAVELEALPDNICALAVAEGEYATLDPLQKWAVARTFIRPRPDAPTPAPDVAPSLAATSLAAIGVS